MIWTLWLIHLSIRFVTTPTLNSCSCLNKKAVRLTLSALPSLYFDLSDWHITGVNLSKRNAFQGEVRFSGYIGLFVYLYFFFSFLLFFCFLLFHLFFRPYSLITHKFSGTYYFSFMQLFWQFKQFNNMWLPYSKELKTPKTVF